MYRSYYNLAETPFKLTADPKFLWLGEKHKEALATLKYGVIDQKGFILVSGDVGTGKTTLINALLENIDEVHRLSKELLEHIRLLSNIELPDEKLINIFFVGQNEYIKRWHYRNVAPLDKESAWLIR